MIFISRILAVFALVGPVAASGGLKKVRDALSCVNLPCVTSLSPIATSTMGEIFTSFSYIFCLFSKIKRRLCNGVACDNTADTDVNGVGCFSPVSTVQVEGQGLVAMKDLQVGDSVLTGSGSYSKVYTFGHIEEEIETEFLQIRTANKQVLEITGEHLVFLSDKGNPIRADRVKVGDMLHGSDTPSKVVKIRSISRKGLYAPLTLEGSVVVDGIVASSYVSFQKDSTEFVKVNGVNTGVSHHIYAHWGLAPYRLFCEGIAKGACGRVYDDIGMPGFVRFAIKLTGFAGNHNGFVHAIFLYVIVLVCGMCMLLENTFGSTLAPLAAFVGGAYFVNAKGIGGANKKLKTV